MRRRVLRQLAAPLAFALCGFPCCAAGQSDDQALAAAASAARAGQYDAAIAVIERALRQSPADPRLWTLEGITYSMKGDDPHALSSLDRALSLNPGFMRALQAEASILSRRQDSQAVPVLRRILEADPKDDTAREMLAVAEAQADHCPAALQQFAVLGSTLETHVTSLQYKAACLLETGAYPEAVSTFQHARDLRPSDTDATYDLATAQLAAGEVQEATATITPLLAHAPDVDTLVLAADIAEAGRETPKAAAYLHDAIVAAPARSELYVRFAELCMSHESYAAGIDMVSAGIARQTHDPMLFLARGLLYGGMSEYDKAEADFHTAEQLDPQHGTGAYAVGVIEAQRDDPEKAMTTVRKGLQEHPEDAQLQFLLAKLLIEGGDRFGSPAFAEAAHAAERAVALKPDLAAAHDLLARIYMDSGRGADAIAQCQAALALNPNDREALYRLMRALRETGKTEEAKEMVHKVAAQFDRAREEETARLRYRIQTGQSPKGSVEPAR